MKRYKRYAEALVVIGLIVLSGCMNDQSGPLAPLAGIDSTLVGPQGKRHVPSISSALPDYWRGRAWHEVCYALSASRHAAGNYGTSTKTISSNGGRWYLGDWFYSPGRPSGNGGPCKQFAAEIVSRATGRAYTLPVGYNYAAGDIGLCRPGDVIQKSDNGGTATPHTAIVFAILARDGSGRATMIDVIDSNWVGTNLIGRHPIPWGNTRLSDFRVW